MAFSTHASFILSSDLNSLPHLTSQEVILSHLVHTTAIQWNFSEIPSDLFNLILQFSSGYGAGKDGHFTVESGNTKTIGRSILNCDKYEFLSIHLEKDSTLQTVRGGLILNVLGDVTIDEGARLSVHCRGYAGGECGYQGESYLGIGSKTWECHAGGGGAAMSDDIYARAGGGGYGTVGSEGERRHLNSKPGAGGQAYGLPSLSFLHFGSGGGGGRVHRGGNGGGVIQINAANIINHGTIDARGGEGGGMRTSDCGGGSGGSIFIKCQGKFENKGRILAKGGRQRSEGGRGGDGRIRIDVRREFKEMIENDDCGDIQPKPEYLGIP